MIPKEKTAVRNYTNGSIPKQLLLFAFPFMASNALQVLYSLVDMLIVGQFVGSFGLSAVSTASQVFTFATMLSSHDALPWLFYRRTGSDCPTGRRRKKGSDLFYGRHSV